MSIEIREFTPEDHAPVVRLWRATPGVVLRDTDALGPVASYLERNRGLSFVAVHGRRIVGAVLVGTDGRRGYLQHLAVATDYRRQGLGRALVQRSLSALASLGIDKCHLMVLIANRDAAEFWRHIGWSHRHDIQLMSHTMSGSANA
jgi:ribosomal protein S18 acetylase RimI-like enzyme